MEQFLICSWIQIIILIPQNVTISLAVHIYCATNINAFRFYSFIVVIRRYRIDGLQGRQLEERNRATLYLACLPRLQYTSKVQGTLDCEKIQVFKEFPLYTKNS